MNVSEFKKQILRNSNYEELNVFPYSSNELKAYATVIVVSDGVDEVTDVYHYKKRIATIIPMKGTIQESFEAYRDEIISRQHVMATYFSVYSFKGEKLFELRGTEG